MVVLQKWWRDFTVPEKRFELEEYSSKGPVIFDNDGVDDYYFLKNKEELKEFVDMLNKDNQQSKKDWDYFVGQIDKLQSQVSELTEDNQTFEKVYKDLKHKHHLLHDEYLDLEIERDDLKQAKKELIEENQELKKDIEYYKEERKALFEYFDKKDDLKLELRVDLND